MICLEQQVREISPIGGFAPGDYLPRCNVCNRQFSGDKRAFHCLPCALKAAPPSREDALQTEVEALKRLLEDALCDHLGAKQFDALKRNGWALSGSVSVLAFNICAALKGASHE